MGYYTNYKLEIHQSDEWLDVEQAQEEVEKISKRQPFDESCTWYDHEEDMKKMSKKYPNTVFLLIGEGENSDDLWKKFFSNGKIQTAKARVTFDSFDPSKLK